MNILIADDNAVSRTSVAGLARKLGHSTILVADGEEAIYAFETQEPDLILMDGQMPVMDGFEVTRRIRAASAQRWIPILFIAAENDHAAIVNALNAGADDYLVKPVHPVMLRAKLEAVDRVRRLYAAGEAQRRHLQSFRDTAEEEGRIAQHLMRNLINTGALEDPMLDFMIVPVARGFSGDLVAAARTPRGALHVLLADAVGHGLAAALNVLPIVPCFYAMTAKGFDLDMIAIELNRTLRQYMPVDRFVAATLLSMDPAARRAKVWNGANPPALALDGSGRVLARFESKNLALGILPESAFEPVVEAFDFTGACQLFACSDGVVDDFGRPADGAQRQGAIERMLVETPPALRLKRLRSALAARTGEGSAHDDMTVVLVNSVQAAGAGAAPALPRMPAQLHFEATFDAGDLREIDVVGLLLGVISGVPGAHFHRHSLGVIVSELFSNALEHGVLGLASSLKDGEAGFERYGAARAAALSALTEGSVAVHIESHRRHGRPVIEMQFRDSGRGHAVAQSGMPAARPRHGRGIELVRALCSKVEYRGCGNDVRVTYVLEDARGEPLRAVA